MHLTCDYRIAIHSLFSYSVQQMATNRQLAQQVRRDQEHQRGLRWPQLSFTQLAQQTRQNREHRAQENQLPIACNPLPPQLVGTFSLRHRLGRCDISCIFCGADHWIEERVQESTIAVPQFSTCCKRGAVMMDKFDDPPQPLYSLLMDSTPCIFPCYIFVDNERQYNSARTFEIITMPSHLVHSALKETSLFMVLKAYILFISKDNCIISSDLYFHYWEDSLHFHRSISTIQILWNKHNITYLTIMIYLM